MKKAIDVTGAGSAIVDVIVHADHGFLARESLAGGSSVLIDDARQQLLLAQFPQKDQLLSSGGSVANSIDVISKLQRQSSFLTRIGIDRYGDHFVADLIDQGVTFASSVRFAGPTGLCLVITTPDGQRTMRVSPGVSSNFTVNDVKANFIQQSEWLFLEGYLLAKGVPGIEALHAALDYAKASGTKVAVTLASEDIVSTYQSEMQDLIDRADLILGNSEESIALTGENDAEKAFAALCNTGCDVAISDGPNGVRICFDDKEMLVPVFSVDRIISTVGAGDTLAGGILFGLVEKVTPEKAVLGGCYLASRVLRQDAPRLAGDYLPEWAEIQQADISGLRQKGWKG